MAGPGTTHQRRALPGQQDGTPEHLDSPAPAAPMGLFTVGAADHPAETAADAAAARALSALDHLRGAGPDAGRDHIHREVGPAHGAEVGRDGGTVRNDTEQRIRGLQGRGRPLPDLLRRQMEQAFDSPLDRVRVHTGAAAAELNNRMSARAFTVGQEIFLGGDQLTSNRPTDRHTLAHEIAHTVQDGGATIHRQWKTPSSLTSHFAKHKAEFNGAHATETEYETAADDLYANRTSYQVKTKGSRTLVYDDSTNTFGVFENGGKGVTLFKPTRGQAYFDGQ